MVVYRTSDVAAGLQFSYWHEVICRHFVPAHSRLERQAAFSASFQTHPLGPFDINRLSAPRHSWSRTGEDVRRAPHDVFLLSLKLDGASCLEQGGRRVEQSVGELALYDTARPFAYLLDSDIVLLKIPRSELLARLPRAEGYTARGFGLRSPVGRLAAHLVRMALDLDLAGNEIAAQRLGSSVVDAVASAMEWELGDAASTPPREVRLVETVKAYLRAHLGNRSIDAEHLARRHGISVRTLNRLFAREGTTPMRWLWAERLAACHAALSSGAAGNSRIIDIALQHGFIDPSHFSRAFKLAYQLRPAEVARNRQR